MGIEIERKFLVSGNSWQDHVTKSRGFRQAYLAMNDRFSMRIRIVDGTDATLTIKSKWRGIRREEYEYPVPLWDAEKQLAWRAGGIVEKTRHYIPDGDLTWEIDVFSGDNAGLVIAEIELESEDQPYPRPPWLGPEVTSDQRYHNATLAMRPFRDWTAEGDADAANAAS